MCTHTDKVHFFVWLAVHPSFQAIEGALFRLCLDRGQEQHHHLWRVPRICALDGHESSYRLLRRFDFRKVSVESCKDSMPNFASEPHPGFKSVKKVPSLNYVFKNWKTNYILQWGVGVHYLKVFWDILIQSMWLLHTNFDHHFFVWHDVTTDGRKMLIRYPATGRCCAPPKSIDIKTNHFEHPPHPPTFCTFFFVRGVIHTPLTILPQENPHLWWTRKHLIPTVERHPPRHIAAIWTPMVPLLRAPLPRCVSLQLRREFASGARLRKPSHLGEIGPGRTTGGAGKKWFRMPGIFPYKNEEPLQWRSDANLFLSWFQVCWLIFFLQMLVCQQGFNWLL